jgi:hypothetical protein
MSAAPSSDLIEWSRPSRRLPNAPSAATILETASRYFRIPTEQLLSRSRTNQMSFARQVMMYLMRTMTNDSYPAIGRYFRRDHSTALHAVTQIALRMQEAAFAVMMNHLAELVRAAHQRLEIDTWLVDFVSAPGIPPRPIVIQPVPSLCKCQKLPPPRVLDELEVRILRLLQAEGRPLHGREITRLMNQKTEPALERLCRDRIISRLSNGNYSLERRIPELEENPK